MGGVDQLRKALGGGGSTPTARPGRMPQKGGQIGNVLDVDMDAMHVGVGIDADKQPWQ